MLMQYLQANNEKRSLPKLQTYTTVKIQCYDYNYNLPKWLTHEMRPAHCNVIVNVNYALFTRFHQYGHQYVSVLR